MSDAGQTIAPRKFLGRRITPLTIRRFHAFRANRRGLWSFWLFLIVFVVTLFAEVIANDRPLLVYYKDNFYFPVAKIYPETTFGGVFQTEADYREKEVQEMIAKGDGWIIWPPIHYSYQTVNFGLNQPAPSPPSR